MWWGNYEWSGKRFIGTEDNWSFSNNLGNDKVKNLDLDSLSSLHKGEREEMVFALAQHSSTLIGKSWSRKSGEPKLNEYDD